MPTQFAPDASIDQMFWMSAADVRGGADSNVERFVLAVASAWVRPADFVVDLGANHGQHARVLIARAGHSGSALLVEADPVLADELRRGADACTARVTVENVAIGDTTGDTVTFFRRPDRDQEGSLFRRDETAEYEEVDVPRTTIDALLADKPTPSFVKIDVEGAEFEALRGAHDLLRDGQPLVACELSNSSWSEETEELPGQAYRLATLLEFVESSGWAAFDLTGQEVTAEAARQPGFSTHYQQWMVKVGSPAHSFVLYVLPALARAFAWGASNAVPYPFHLDQHPVLQEDTGLGTESAPVAGAPSGGQAQLRALEESVRRLRRTNDSLEQASFERERMIAWYAAETTRYRRRWEDREHETHEWRLAADEQASRVGEILGSTSWRSTLPLRVARRPSAYVRKLLQR